MKRSKKNRPAPQPPRPSDLEIRAPSELLVGVPGALKTQWKHQPFVLVTGAVTYVANVSILSSLYVYKCVKFKCGLSFKTKINIVLFRNSY